MAAVPSTKRVLVVDGYRDHADSLVELLRRAGAQAAACYGASAGLDLAAQFRPDVAIIEPATDDGRPLNGLRLARLLRQRHPPDGLMLVAVTTIVHPTRRLAALRASFDAYLVKPTRLEDLRMLLLDRRCGCCHGTLVTGPGRGAH